MHPAVIFFVICSKKGLQVNDMYIIVVSAQGPIAVRHTVYGADDIFILVKRSVLGCAFFNSLPKLLRKPSSGSRIVIRIYYPFFLTGEIKGYLADLDS